MAGEFFYFLIYVAQQLGIMLGVGAQTVLLCAHLLAVHHGEKENPHAAYAQAARFALGVGFFLIIISGLFAIAIHLQSGQADIVLSPAFLFKWALIIVLLVAFFLQSRLREQINFYYAFTGTTWYALFLVHSLGPVTSWGSLWVLYILWAILFSLVWTGFVVLMRSGIKKPISTPAPIIAPVIKKEVPRLVLPPVAVVAVNPRPSVRPPSWWSRLFAWLSTPKKIPIAAPMPPPKPTPPPPPSLPSPLPPPAPKPVPPPPPPPAPKPVPPPPPPLPPPKPIPPPPPPPVIISVPPPPPPPPAIISVAPPPIRKPGLMQEVINHLLVPALRIMPQKPEDIGKHNRPPVVKPDA